MDWFCFQIELVENVWIYSNRFVKFHCFVWFINDIVIGHIG